MANPIIRLVKRRDGVGYQVDEETGCWNWTGTISRLGYGIKRAPLINGKRKTRTAHRWYYEQVVGPLPKKWVLDHLCRNRRCINPEHMEPVTRGENQRRGRGTGKLNYKQRAEVVRRYRAGNISLSKLGAKYGITASSVRDLIHNWFNIELEKPDDPHNLWIEPEENHWVHL